MRRGGGGVAYHTVLFAYIVHAFYACTPHALRLRKWYSIASNTESGTAFAIPALPPDQWVKVAICDFAFPDYKKSHFVYTI